MSGIGKTFMSIFKGPKVPEVSIPKIPDPRNPLALAAERKKQRSRLARGREGTIFSGSAYQNQNLGGTQ